MSAWRYGFYHLVMKISRMVKSELLIESLRAPCFKIRVRASVSEKCQNLKHCEPHQISSLDSELQQIRMRASEPKRLLITSFSSFAYFELIDHSTDTPRNIKWRDRFEGTGYVLEISRQKYSRLKYPDDSSRSYRTYMTSRLGRLTS